MKFLIPQHIVNNLKNNNMIQLSHKGIEFTIVEVLKNKHYKLYINSKFHQYYDNEDTALNMAIHTIDLFYAKEKE